MPIVQNVPSKHKQTQKQTQGHTQIEHSEIHTNIGALNSKHRNCMRGQLFLKHSVSYVCLSGWNWGRFMMRSRGRMCINTWEIIIKLDEMVKFNTMLRVKPIIRYQKTSMIYL